jgi:hypothetical protein
MVKEYYILSWELREHTAYAWEAKAKMHDKVQSVLDNIENLEQGKRNGRVDNIVIRRFVPRTGETSEMEPFLDGWKVSLRVKVDEQKSLMQLQRGE